MRWQSFDFDDKYRHIAYHEANPREPDLKSKMIHPGDRLMGYGATEGDLGLVALKEPPKEIAREKIY